MRGYLLAFAAIGTAALGLPLAGCSSSEETQQVAKVPTGPRLVQ